MTDKPKRPTNWPLLFGTGALWLVLLLIALPLVKDMDMAGEFLIATLIYGAVRMLESGIERQAKIEREFPQ